MNSLTYLSGDQAKTLDDLYTRFKENPKAVPEDWRALFGRLDAEETAEGPIPSFSLASDSDEKDWLKLMAVQNIMNRYRSRGYQAANLDPLGIQKPDREAIDALLNSLSEAEKEEIFDSGIKVLGEAPLREIIDWFEKTYCGTIGAEHYYLDNREERLWLQSRMEETANHEPLSAREKLRIFEKLYQAHAFERFLAKKYIGKKRFSLEGGESLIPLLDTIIELAGEYKTRAIVIGMAHRGRLNVLANTLQKPIGVIFAEFEENYDPSTPDYADVKYHLGYSNRIMTMAGHEVHTHLAFNPSHLEAADPVVLGSVRARQQKFNDTRRNKNFGVLIHGDAAFAGQGVVAETLNLMNLEGYDTGGTIHIVVNNQIGFTTLPDESRSTRYATDLAKGFQIPIFHVNGDDPEAVFRTVRLAMEFKMKFNKDVIIDLICYRRLGHNEMDEPAFTQPKMYEIIKKHKPAAEIYYQKLVADPEVGKESVDLVRKGVDASLEEAFKVAHEKNIVMEVDTLQRAWSAYKPSSAHKPPKTKLDESILVKIGMAATTFPESFKPHPKMAKLFEQRRKMILGEEKIDWGCAEMLSFASILRQGRHIRFSGQDAQRGTFSHRHDVLNDVTTGEKYIPLSRITDDQGEFEIINSPLSEYSVVGFEYGYSLAHPSALVIWEAQFGDFANGAQIIFDQFLSSSEVKWHRMSGLVLLLPHGYEGQGPEHSSARIERFLQLCAEDNMQVCIPSTPGQYFHLLRRQILLDYRKPLVIFTPKSLLRLPESMSNRSDLLKTKFQEVYPGPNGKKPDQVRKVILCAGKVYYDLLAEYKKRSPNDTQILRIEQIYPFPEEKLSKELARFKSLKKVLWLQEEPENMGAWTFAEHLIEKTLPNGVSLAHVARKPSPSPAAGLSRIHYAEQAEIVDKALNE